MCQAQLRHGLGHQAFARPRPVLISQPLAQLIERRVGFAGNLSRNRIMQANQLRRYVAALWPGRDLTR